MLAPLVEGCLQWADLNNRLAPFRVDPSVSDTPLALPEYSHGGLAEVECLSAPASIFLTAIQGEDFHPRSDSWYRYAVLHDGSTYVSWDTVGEFLVAADGRRITCRRIEKSSVESFQVYMLGQALSFALVRQRFATEGADAVGSTPQQFSQFIANEIAKWTKVVKDAGIKAEF